MEGVTQSGNQLVSDRHRVSASAFNVWKYYFKNRGDVNKTPLAPPNWYDGPEWFDQTKFASPDPKTWPPTTDDSWILQSGYTKSPSDINNPEMVQKFALGGLVPESAFGTGAMSFPASVTEKYTSEQMKTIQRALTDPNTMQNERVIVDDKAVQDQFNQKPLDKSAFISSFTKQISRDSLFSDMANFAKAIGIPGESLTSILPQLIDFEAPSQEEPNAFFDREAMGSFGVGATELAKFGWTEQNEQDLYGYRLLAKENSDKLMQTISSSSHDPKVAAELWEKEASLGLKLGEIRDLRIEAAFAARKVKQSKVKETGRGALSFSTSETGPALPNSVLYHELTHQVFNSLRTKVPESFDKYKTKVSGLFEGDNDDIANAVDALPGINYNSADMAYGRQYKVNSLFYSMKPLYGSLDAKEKETFEAMSKVRQKGIDLKQAKTFKPFNPEMNQTLLDSKVDQTTISRMEDSGKEEFLTTLVQNIPNLDNNLNLILESSLTDLLGSAGISRQKFAKGGAASDTVPAMLTPGEFVINKKAAQSIGYNKLARMNHADKVQGFARGGVVGGVQRFAVGGEAIAQNQIRVNTAVASMSKKDAAIVSAAMKKDAAAFDALSMQLYDAGKSTTDVVAALKSMARSISAGNTAEQSRIKALSAVAVSSATTYDNKVEAAKQHTAESVGLTGPKSRERDDLSSFLDFGPEANKQDQEYATAELKDRLVQKRDSGAFDKPLETSSLQKGLDALTTKIGAVVEYIGGPIVAFGSIALIAGNALERMIDGATEVTPAFAGMIQAMKEVGPAMKGTQLLAETAGLGKTGQTVAMATTLVSQGVSSYVSGSDTQTAKNSAARMANSAESFDTEAAKVSGPELKLGPGESVNDVMNKMRDNLGAMASEIGTPLENSTLLLSTQIKNAADAVGSFVFTLLSVLGAIKEASGKSSGGVVYRSRGGSSSDGVNFAPKGTDTVPAMLTPGEFVINKQASSKHSSLLSNINSGKYKTGGVVYAAKGMTTAIDKDGNSNIGMFDTFFSQLNKTWNPTTWGDAVTEKQDGVDKAIQTVSRVAAVTAVVAGSAAVAIAAIPTAVVGGTSTIAAGTSVAAETAAAGAGTAAAGAGTAAAGAGTDAAGAGTAAAGTAAAGAGTAAAGAGTVAAQTAAASATQAGAAATTSWTAKILANIGSMAALKIATGVVASSFSAISSWMGSSSLSETQQQNINAAPQLLDRETKMAAARTNIYGDTNDIRSTVEAGKGLTGRAKEIYYSGQGMPMEEGAIRTQSRMLTKEGKNKYGIDIKEEDNLKKVLQRTRKEDAEYNTANPTQPKRDRAGELEKDAKSRLAQEAYITAEKAVPNRINETDTKKTERMARETEMVFGEGADEKYQKAKAKQEQDTTNGTSTLTDAEKELIETRVRVMQLSQAELATRNAEMIAITNANRKIKELNNETDRFVAQMTALSNSISRASKEMAVSIDMTRNRVGTKTGEAGTFTVDRSNENVLGNVGAYSATEVRAAATQTGNQTGMLPEVSNALADSAVANQILINQLPKIMADATANPGIEGPDTQIRDQLTQAFEAANLSDPTKVPERVNSVMTTIEQARDTQSADTSVAGINKMAEMVAATTQSAAGLKVLQEQAKAANDALQLMTTEAIHASDAFGKAQELRNTAQNIRTEGANSLAKVQGKELSLDQQNKPFNDTIASLTNTPRTGGASTTDAAEIGRRLDKLDDDLPKAQKEMRDAVAADAAAGKPAKGGAGEKATANFVGLKKESDNLAKALQKLSTDTSRAANALNRIQEIEQSNKGPQEKMLEVMSNIDNPEYMQNIIKQADSHARVMSGNGSISDLKDAVEGQKMRELGMTSAQAQESRKGFIDKTAPIMSGQTGGAFTEAQIQTIFRYKGTEQNPAMQEARADFAKYTEDQAKANETAAGRFDAAGIAFQAGVVSSGAEFFNIVQAAAQVIADTNQADKSAKEGRDIARDAQNATPPDAEKMAAAAEAQSKAAEEQGRASAVQAQAAGAQERAAAAAAAAPPRQWSAGTGYANGGPIYASKGSHINFQPKGTDTVPAMLTPGEFVVNRAATQKNLPLLKSINSGAQGYERGGVAYLAVGGIGGPKAEDWLVPEDWPLNEDPSRSYLHTLWEKTTSDAFGKKMQEWNTVGKYDDVEWASLQKNINKVIDQLPQRKIEATDVQAQRSPTVGGDRLYGGRKGLTNKEWIAQIRGGQVNIPNLISSIDEYDGHSNEREQLEVLEMKQKLAAAGVPAVGVVPPAAVPPAVGVAAVPPVAGVAPLPATPAAPPPIPYYDELTYKEAIYKGLKNRQMPFAPDRNLFKTGAKYVGGDQLSDPKLVEQMKAGGFNNSGILVPGIPESEIESAQEIVKNLENIYWDKYKQYQDKMRSDGVANNMASKYSFLDYMKKPENSKDYQTFVADASISPAVPRILDNMFYSSPVRTTGVDIRATSGTGQDRRGILGDTEGFKAYVGEMITANSIIETAINKIKPSNILTDEEHFKILGDLTPTLVNINTKTRTMLDSLKPQKLMTLDEMPDGQGLIPLLTRDLTPPEPSVRIPEGFIPIVTETQALQNEWNTRKDLAETKKNIPFQSRPLVDGSENSVAAPIESQLSPQQKEATLRPPLPVRPGNRSSRPKPLQVDIGSDQLRAYKGPESQFQSSMSLYKRTLGQYNYDAMLRANGQAYINSSPNGKERRKEQDDKNIEIRRKQYGWPQYAQNGGTIYRSRGGSSSDGVNFVPKGTDTVPAMLTAGEFVVNREATQKNLPLLKSINGGARGYENGGVAYLAGGNIAGGLKNVGKLGAKANKLIHSQDIIGAMIAGTNLSETILTPLLDAGGLLPKPLLELLTARIPQLSLFNSSAVLLQKLADLANGSSEKNDKGTVAQVISGGLEAVNITTSIGGVVAAIMKLKGDEVGAKLIGGIASKGVSFFTMLSGAFDGYNDAKAKDLGMDPVTRSLLGAVSGSASSGGAQTGGAVSAGIGRPLTEIEDERLAALEAAGRGAMIGASVAGPPGAVAGALVGAASESAKVGSEVWYLWGENAARQKKLDAQLVVIKRDIKLRQNMRINLDKLIAQSMTLESGSKEYDNNILSINTQKADIRKLGGVVDEDEIPDRLAKTDTNRFGTQQMSSGGTVYASQGSHINFQPRGTDTVPAMLTPGEFVVNSASTAKNLPLLRAINSRGSSTSYHSHGGAVKYLAEGSGGSGGVLNGIKLDLGDFSDSTAAFVGGIGVFASNAQAFKDGATSIASALGSLGNIKDSFSGLGGITTGLVSAATLLQTNIGSLSSSLSDISKALSDIPRSIEFKVSGSIPVHITVDVNGGDGLEAKLQPFANQIFTAIEKGLSTNLAGTNIVFDKNIVIG